MATFLDVTGLQYFTNVFVFIFTWIVVYALLAYGNILGKNIAVHVLGGLIIALLVILSPIATGVIAYIAPWFGVLFVFVIFVVMAMRSFGASTTQIAGVTSLKWAVIIIVILIMVVGSLAYIRETADLPEGENVDYSKSVSVIFHPKILGAIFILLIAIFTIALLVGRST